MYKTVCAHACVGVYVYIHIMCVCVYIYGTVIRTNVKKKIQIEIFKKIHKICKHIIQHNSLQEILKLNPKFIISVLNFHRYKSSKHATCF